MRIWDLPTRLFHWALAVCVLVQLVTGALGGLQATRWHFRFGLAMLALLLFRVVWGLVGGRWSRFASWLLAPSTLWRYLRGDSRAGERLEVGHSPLGSLSVAAMLVILLLQVGTGLLADDNLYAVGPLSQYVSAAATALATAWHTGWGLGLLLGLVALHLAAVVYHVVRKRRTLVRPMLTGDKLLPAGTPASADSWATRLLALLVLAAFAALAAWIRWLGG